MSRNVYIGGLIIKKSKGILSMKVNNIVNFLVKIEGVFERSSFLKVVDVLSFDLGRVIEIFVW